MEARPRDAAATRSRILAAARELFASRGYHGTSIRRIAAEAGVDHALVLRYFGDKERLLTLLLEDESLGFRATRGLDADAGVALEQLKGIYTTALTDGRLTLRLLLRAEMDGVTPESLLEGKDFPMASFATWMEDGGQDTSAVDPRALAMVLGAAGFGIAAAQPLLTAAVGWQDEDQDEVRRRCIDAMVALIGCALGDREAAPEAGA